MTMDHLDEQIDLAAYKAMTELSEKSLSDIQRETAITWAGRAISAYAIFERTGNIYMLLDGEEYGHEAIEHSALAGPVAFSEAIRRRLDVAKFHAIRE